MESKIVCEILADIIAPGALKEILNLLGWYLGKIIIIFDTQKRF